MGDYAGNKRKIPAYNVHYQGKVSHKYFGWIFNKYATIPAFDKRCNGSV